VQALTLPSSFAILILENSTFDQLNFFSKTSTVLRIAVRAADPVNVRLSGGVERAAI
jgi:hypothetical protein